MRAARPVSLTTSAELITRIAAGLFFFSIGMWAIAVSCLRARHLSVALVIAYVPRCLRLPSFLCILHC